ncbi:MAG TPA: hypothetical protein VIM50_06190 [Candidatus Limnocylindria bacterium]
MRTTLVTMLAFAALLGACGGAGAGGTVPQTTQTTAPTGTSVPVVADTAAPKQYDPGKTANPSSSPADYYGY